MPRQKIIIHSQPSQLYTEQNIPETTIDQLSQGQSSLMNRASKKSFVNFREYVRSNLQTSKDHLHRQYPADLIHNKQESTYQNHYIKKEMSLKDLPKQKFEQLKNDGRIEILSTQKHDFVTYNSPRVKHVRPIRPQSSTIAFSAKSTYAATFIDWNQVDLTESITNKHSTVLKDIPLAGRSQYKEQFQGMKSPPAQSFQKRSIFRSPMNPQNMPLETESTSMYAYKPFTSNGVQQRMTPNRSNMLYSPSYSGQYRTNYRKDYTNKIQEEIDNYQDEF